MKKKFFQVSLLVMTLELMLLGALRSVPGLEFSKADNAGATVTIDSGWRLVIGGAVNNTLDLTFDELVAMPNITEYAELYCFGASVTCGDWTGVRLGLLLEKAGFDQQAKSVSFCARDGYSTVLSITEAMREDVILAYEKDGQPLSETLRLVIPNANGSEWIATIIEITVNTVPLSVPEIQTTPAPSPTHPQTSPDESSQTTQKSSTKQPNDLSVTLPEDSETPVLQPAKPSLTQQPIGFLGSTLPMECGYAIVWVAIVVVSVVIGYLFYARAHKLPKEV